MIQTDLRFLLKEKYRFSERQVEEFIKGQSGIGNIESFPNIPLSKHKLKALQDDIERLLKSYPVDYLIGYKEFLGIKINLKYKPLIPRPETEYWVEQAIQNLVKDSAIKGFLTNVSRPQETPNNMRGLAAISRGHLEKSPLEQNHIKVLDIFCGSGCIGLAVLKYIPNSQVIFADISDNALKQTKYNLERNKVKPLRYQIIKSDILKSVNGQFDVVFANPPYIAINSKVGKEIFYEPSAALYGGKEGLDLIEKFIAEISGYSPKPKMLFMEFGEDQKNAIEKILKNYNFKSYKFQKDQYGKWRWISVHC